MEQGTNRVSYIIPAEAMESRLDVFLAECDTALSRSRIKALIKSGNVKVNNATAKPGYRLKTGDAVSLSIPPPTRMDLEPEAVDFDIIHEDSGLIVVNKPPGIVVHPAPGHPSGTLVHGLLRHCSGFSGIGGELRPGIVHRLDKDTSGLLVVAKNDRVHASLTVQFKSRTVKKRYLALVYGRMPRLKGRIDLPIGRHPKKRKEMSVSEDRGRTALTEWQALEEFNGEFTLLAVRLRTGRTHQIRVHLSHIGHAIVGDGVYGRGRNWWKRRPLYRAGKLPPINRQMLHAENLGFVHPETGNYVEFSADPPDDMKHLLEALRGLA